MAADDPNARITHREQHAGEYEACKHSEEEAILDADRHDSGGEHQIKPSTLNV
jgi:hypothetical protein